MITLYADNGTAEQLHSEFTSDLDMEYLTAGKFATNALVLASAQLAYNVLRWIGQNGLRGPDAPPHTRTKLGRIRTVMQDWCTWPLVWSIPHGALSSPSVMAARWHAHDLQRRPCLTDRASPRRTPIAPAETLPAAQATGNIIRCRSNSLAAKLTNTTL